MTDILQRIQQQKIWLLLIVVCFLIQLFQLHEYLLFDRGLVSQWQLWRLFSAHITHMGWTHYWLNMAGIAFMLLFFSSYLRAVTWLASWIFLMIFVSAGILLDGQLDRYLGLSAVLHGLFVMGGYLEYQRFRLSGMVILLLILLKLLWEQLYGALPGSESMVGGKVAINSHLYGAIGGAVFILLMKKLMRVKS